MRFPSKIGLELIVPLVIILGGTLTLMLIQSVWLGVVMVALVAAFVVHMMLTTYYTLDGDLLKVKCGYLFNATVNVQSIKSIKETNNVLSSPAASLHRLEITYGKYDTVMVSPKDKAGFITALKSINPAIEVKLKK